MTERIAYHWESDYLIPNLEAPENPTEPIGKYGRMREKYLKQHRRGIYTAMMIRGTLLSHLSEIDKTAREQVDLMVRQMAESEGFTEQLKAALPMKWTGLMNNLLHSAEEVVLEQIVYA